MKYYEIIPEAKEGADNLVCKLDEKTLRIGWNTASGDNAFDFTPNDFDWGKPIEGWPEGVTFFYEKKEGDMVPDYFCSDFSFLLFSKKAVDGLKVCQKKEFELLHASLLETKEEMRDESYKIVNVINVIDVIDWEYSNYSKISIDKEDGNGEIFYNMMIKPVFKKDELESIRPHIFKTKDDEAPVYVSEEFKNYCEREKLTGFEFYEIKQR